MLAPLLSWLTPSASTEAVLVISGLAICQDMSASSTWLRPPVILSIVGAEAPSPPYRQRRNGRPWRARLARPQEWRRDDCGQGWFAAYSRRRRIVHLTSSRCPMSRCLGSPLLRLAIPSSDPARLDGT